MKSILYVEDQAVYGEVIQRLHATVHAKFYGEVKFSVAEDWRSAMESITLDPPSVLLLDLSIPPMTETDTIAAMNAATRRALPFPPVMVLTGNKFDLDLRRKCFLNGADDFMIKDDANRSPELLCERIYHCFLRRLRDERA